MGIKIIFVDNPHDRASREAREAFVRRWSPEGRIQAVLDKLAAGESIVEEPIDALAPEAEIHIVDFQQLRAVLPIRAAPCVLLVWPELEEAFAVEDVAETALLVQEAFAAKRQGRSVVVADDTGEETIRGRRVFGPPMEPSAEGQ